MVMHILSAQHQFWSDTLSPKLVSGESLIAVNCPALQSVSVLVSIVIAIPSVIGDIMRVNGTFFLH